MNIIKGDIHEEIIKLETNSIELHITYDLFLYINDI